MWYRNVQIVIYVIRGSQLLVLYMINSPMVIRGEIIQQPESVTTDAGKTVTFTCTSNIFKHDIHWYWSAARQPSATIIYDGALNFSNQKFKVLSEVVNNTRISTLTINSITPQEAGTLMCRDDDSLGQSTSVQISVIWQQCFSNVGPRVAGPQSASVAGEKPSCSAVCMADVLYLTCSFCYWSENPLSTRWLLGSTNVTHVDEMHSKEVFNTRCLQHRSYAVVERSCQEVDELSMIVYDSKTNTSSQSYNIAVKLDNSETSETSIDPVQPTTPAGEERGNPFKTVVILVIVTIVLVIVILLLLVATRRELQRRCLICSRKKPHGPYMDPHICMEESSSFYGPSKSSLSKAGNAPLSEEKSIQDLELHPKYASKEMYLFYPPHMKHKVMMKPDWEGSSSAECKEFRNEDLEGHLPIRRSNIYAEAQDFDSRSWLRV